MLHTDQPVPEGFWDIADWILHYLYYHNTEKQSTRTLLPLLDAVLRAEPSQLDECNRINGLLGSPKIDAEEYAARRTPDLPGVQKAVETLIRKKLVSGDIGTDKTGAVIFSELAITKKGVQDALNRAHEKEERAKPRRGLEISLDKARKRVEEQ